VLPRVVQASGFAATVLVASTLTGCSHRSPGDPGEPIPTVPGKRCVVHLHGKSGHGAAPKTSGDVTHLHPDGNASGWGGRQWLYFPDDEYAKVKGTVSRSIASAGCDRVVVHGFSNGAAAAAKLFCRGERFDGHVVGYIADDPVADHGVDGCKPAPDVRIKVYWTGALATAVDGWDCAAKDWTCEGGKAIGIERYTALLGTVRAASPHDQHREYESPPEYAEWLAP
jgi:hypothetical protein